MKAIEPKSIRWRLASSALAAFAVGNLGGLIGLGGAEFRLPLLISVFAFVALEAVVLNKAISLIVVASSLAFRSNTIPFAQIADHWHIIANLLAGSLLGALFGADLATRLAPKTLYRIIAVLLITIAAVLVISHDSQSSGQPIFTGSKMIVVGIAAGIVIGMIASLLGVAGGEFLIPTLVLLFGLDVKLAGSLSLAISLPTMLVGFARYSRDRSFRVLRANRKFVLAMAAGSIVGAFVGSRMLGYMPATWLVPLLAAILVASALKIWLHSYSPSEPHAGATASTKQRGQP